MFWGPTDSKKKFAKQMLEKEEMRSLKDPIEHYELLTS
jgi:hypothetical protein